MVDLSFTKDPVWIECRNKKWSSFSEGLKDSFRKKEIEIIKHYFFTGELLEDYRISEGARLNQFPLATHEGWDYVFEYLVEDVGVFEERLYLSVQDRSDLFSQDEQLSMWDYFLGDRYAPVVKSRVPVGREKKIVELELNYPKLLTLIMASLSTWIGDVDAYGDNPKWVVKIDYFYSMLPYFKNEYFLNTQKRSKEAKAARMIVRLMTDALTYTADANYEPHRKAFLENLIHTFDTMENLPDCLKAKWAEVKAEYGK